MRRFAPLLSIWSLLGLTALTYVTTFGLFAVRINVGVEQRRMVNLGHWDVITLAEYDPKRDKGRVPKTTMFCKYWTGWEVQFLWGMTQQCPLIYRAHPLY